MQKKTIALADDHVLLRNGLAALISSLDEFEVLFEADNGKEFLEKLKDYPLPDIVLMDINMPEMDGYDTALWMKRNHPEIKMLALSMYENEQCIIRMLKCGVKGYILKDIDPVEFRAALDSLIRKGYYYSDLVTGKLIHAVNNSDNPEQKINNTGLLTEREIEFLKHTCTEMTYKEIADKMFLSVRTIEGYRDDLFEKLNVRTRVGLAMYSIRNGIVSLSL
jgi:two-component system, NarL family, invasion response regulator UvrY